MSARSHDGCCFEAVAAQEACGALSGADTAARLAVAELPTFGAIMSAQPQRVIASAGDGSASGTSLVVSLQSALRSHTSGSGVPKSVSFHGDDTGSHSGSGGSQQRTIRRVVRNARQRLMPASPPQQPAPALVPFTAEPPALDRSVELNRAVYSKFKRNLLAAKR
jgi:hypothetical protein